jgi:phage terminase Nu1 subunit (DNA packaging protein)
MLATRQQWCAIAGWTSREFDRNIALGFPAKKNSGSKGEVWRIDTVAGIAWIVAQAMGEQGDGPLDERAERARLLKHQANLAEMEEEKRRGRTIDVEETLTALQAQDVAIKDALLAVPTAAADRALDASRTLGARGIARTYDEAIRAAMRALASAKVVSSLAS